MRFSVVRFGEYLVVSTLIACLLALPGCKKSEGLGAVTMGSVKGKVTLDNQAPPAGCKITFTHKEKMWPATADIGADGSYTLMFNGKPEIPTGTYQVHIVAASTGPTADPSNPEAYKAMMIKSNPMAQTPPTAVVIPAKYQNAAKSGLTCTVLEGKETVFDVPIKSGE
jgi:hypothetical protein